MADSSGDEAPVIDRCDFCRLPIPRETVTATVYGDEYEFCSTACRNAMTQSDRVFTRFHGHRRFDPGVAALRAGLPEGVPRNSFVLLTDLSGSRSGAVQAELVWRTLQRGEPAVLLSFLEPPVSVVQTFLDLEWNVLPYLEDGLLRIVDAFSYRVDDRERLYDRFNEWNTHLRDVTEAATATVRDSSEIRELQSRLDSALEALSMHDTGVVVIDSLTELGSLVQPVQAYNFLKDVRADVCKGRFVPVFAGATMMSEEVTFPHDLRYAVDGIVEMRPNEELVEGALVKQIRVREMDGVLTYPEWTAYEYTPGKGIVTFDPIEELERSEDEREGDAPAAAEEASSDAEDSAEESGSGSAAPQGSAAAATDGSDSGVPEP